MYASLDENKSIARRGAPAAGVRMLSGPLDKAPRICLAMLVLAACFTVTSSPAIASEGQGGETQGGVPQSGASKADSGAIATDHASKSRSTLEKRFDARDLSVNPLRPSKKPITNYRISPESIPTPPLKKQDNASPAQPVLPPNAQGVAAEIAPPSPSQITPPLSTSPIVPPAPEQGEESAPRTIQEPTRTALAPAQNIERLPEPISDPTFQFITGQISAEDAFVKPAYVQPALAESSSHSISEQFAASFASYYSQEETPLPPPDLGGRDARPATGGIGSSNTGTDSEEKLGQAPEDFSLQFLRTQTVLLDPGEWQVDVGLDYTLFENDFPTLTIPGNVLAEGRFRERLLVMPIEFRFGLSTYAQVYLNVPVGWVNTEIAEPGLDAFGNGGGLGDIRGGLTWQIRESSGCGCDPDVIMNFGFTAPTGDESLLQLLLGSPTNDFGEGVWAGSWNVLFIHTYDPIAVFYGVGSRHRVERNFNGVMVAPGDEYLYQMGLGFAVNESVTLSTSFLGQYITEPKINGQRVQGLIQEPMRLRFAATIANACRCSIVEPFAEIGMTRDAPSARIGMTWTF